MEQKNYTLNCTMVGEVNSENIKEMAKVMVWNCCPCTYKDDEVTAVASASFGMDGKPNHMWVIIDGKHYNFPLTSKRVSEKMGKEIIEYILKAVAFYKAENNMEKIITKKEAKERAGQLVKRHLLHKDEPMCYEDNGLHWQVYFQDDDTIVLCVEGYSEERTDWETINDVADIIYEFVNR